MAFIQKGLQTAASLLFRNIPQALVQVDPLHLFLSSIGAQ